MSRSTSGDVEAPVTGLDRETRAELRRQLKRDKITFAEYMRRSVQAYSWIYPGPEYRPPGPDTQ